MYTVELSDEAIKDLERLDPSAERLVTNRLNWLGENAESVNHRALTGRWAGFYRLRAGNYRVLYSIDRENRRLVVELIGHRSEVYRRG